MCGELSVGESETNTSRYLRKKNLCEHLYYSVHAAIKHFSKAFSKVNTVRDCVKAYNRELQRKHSVTEIGDLLVAEFSLTSCT